MTKQELQEFKIKIADTLYYCQIIENDLKAIYSIAVSNNTANLYKTFNELSKDNLGDLLQKFKEQHYLEKRELDTLHNLRRIRNDICYQIFNKFVYFEGEKQNKEFNTQFFEINKNLSDIREVSASISQLKSKELDKQKRWQVN